jgi:hypothetical protein
VRGRNQEERAVPATRDNRLKRMDFTKSEVDEDGGSRREPELTGVKNPEHREISGSLPGAGRRRSSRQLNTCR